MTSAATAAPEGDADIAVIGALLADPGRCQILLALADGRALPASRLASEASVTPATASSHLGKLLAARLLDVEQHGRHRYYRLAGPEVGSLIETLAQLAPARPIRSLRQGTRAQALRNARTCYDHLAGKLGVALMAALIDRRLITGGDGVFHAEVDRGDPRAGYGRDVDYRLTDDGYQFLTDFGAVLPVADVAIRYCVDWSEQRHHLSGAAGKALRVRFEELDWIRRQPNSRAVTATRAGQRGFRETFGIDQNDSAQLAAT
jgi:DNA-binding transcriptional ArsR family regulator